MSFTTTAPPTAPAAESEGFDAESRRYREVASEGLVHAARRRVESALAAVGRPAWRVVRPVLVAVRPLGWVALVGAVGGWVVSRALGWQEFTVLALALAGALVVAVISALGHAKYQVNLDLRSSRVVVGEKATGQLTVTNAARRRLLPARIELPVGIGVASFPLPSLRAGEQHEESFLIPTQRRAVIPVGPARSVRGDAFGMIRRVVRWTLPELLYVHPRTVALEGAAPGFLKDLEGQATKELSNDDVSFHALRNYVPGDDWRYIHWKSSARSLATPARTLMVRQFEETRRSHLAVTLSTRAGDYDSAGEFELAVGVAASLGVQALRETRQLSIITSGTPLASATVSRMLDGFSGVEPGPDEIGIVAVARNAARHAPDVSVSFVVCGSQPTPAEIRSAALAFPLGVRVLAIRTVAGAATSMSRIGDTTVLTVGDLGDLPRALRQAVRSS